jgi:hypothetical protein
VDPTTACRNVVGLTRVFRIAAAQRADRNEVRRAGLNEAQRAGLNEAQRDVRTSPDEDLHADRAGRRILSLLNPETWNPAAWTAAVTPRNDLRGIPRLRTSQKA